MITSCLRYVRYTTAFVVWRGNDAVVVFKMRAPWEIFLLLCVAIGIESAEQNRVAVAHLLTDVNKIDLNVTGTVWFTETNDGVLLRGFIKGKEPGRYGFHIHELGDTTDCYSTGAHFNPDQTNHGGRDHAVRHVGDLGNVDIEDEVQYFNFTDSTIALRGRNNILGRSLVLHEREDDLGLTDHPDSLTTGNAGPRVACAVIGTHAPVEAWYISSSTNIIPSIGLLALVLMLRSYL